MREFNFDTTEYYPIRCSIDKKVYAFKTLENTFFWENSDFKIIKCFPVNEAGNLELSRPIEISSQYLFDLFLKSNSVDL